MYLAWTGRDSEKSPNLLNITVSGSTKVKLSGETSSGAPSLSTYVSPLSGDPTLYYGWRGTNGVINFLSSTDGKKFGSKVELKGETTALASALAPAPYFPVHTAANDPAFVSQLATWVEDSWGHYSQNAQVFMVTFTVSQSPAAVSSSLYLYNANASDRFMIGSVQKVFTGTLLAARQAASEQATYKDDDPAAPYLNFSDPIGNIAVITLSDLATMTSRMERQIEKPAPLTTLTMGAGRQPRLIMNFGTPNPVITTRRSAMYRNTPTRAMSRLPSRCRNPTPTIIISPCSVCSQDRSASPQLTPMTRRHVCQALQRTVTLPPRTSRMPQASVRRQRTLRISSESS
jgi:hypothetical protein